MSVKPTGRPPTWLQAGIMILLGVIVSGLLFHRVSWEDWSRPHWLVGDPVEVYARVRIAAEEPWQALLSFARIDRLGAPLTADWSLYPVPDRLVFVFTGLLSRIVGLIAAIHVVSALITGLNAASFYLCARWLRCRWEWAAALGFVFAFCSYNIRWGITLSLNQTFVLPPLILLFAHAGRKGGTVGSNRGWYLLAAGCGLWLGFANPYLTYFAGVVGGGTLLLALLRHSPRQRLLPLLVFFASVSISFLASNGEYLLDRMSGEISSVLVRGAGDFHVYALRPLEWLIPPADHRLPVLAKIGQAYFDRQNGIGEFFYNYLGLVGAAGMAGLLLISLCRMWQRRWRTIDPVIGLAWIIVFGLSGGISTWLGNMGLELFRASTRIGIYAHVWALLFACTCLTGNSRRLPRYLSILLAGLLAVSACWEETPPLGDRSAGERNLRRWHAYQAVTASLEKSLGEGATIFQLPVVPFPEAGQVDAMPDYEHALPLLTSETLRFSYGNLLDSPALKWALYQGDQPAAVMIPALEQAGFSALWLDQRAYPDRGDSIIRSILGLGRAELVIPGLELPVRIFRLHPAESPRMPDYRDPRLSERWKPGPNQPGQPLALARRGWFPLESEGNRHWRWATRSASLGLWSDHASQATLRFRLVGPEGSSVELRIEEQLLAKVPTGPGEHEVSIHLGDGLTSVVWVLNGPTFNPGKQDPRELGFMVENLSVSVP